MVGGVPQSDLSSVLSTATKAAPELKNDPGTAVSVAAGGGDVAQKAQAVQHAKNTQAIAHAADDMGQGGFLGALEHAGTDAVKYGAPIVQAGKSLVGGAAKLMNAPLRTVQQEYRYLHDVEARHGMGAAVTEGLGLLAGAAAGTVADPGEGTILGTEAAAWLEGHVQYQDSWQRAANPNYKDPHTGQLVSFGRDVSDFVGARTGSFHNDLSGALDAMFDLGLDPVANAGKIYGSVYSQGGAGGMLGKVFTGTSTATAESVEQASFLPRVQMAFRDIANSDAGTIAVRYPALKRIALTLEADTTPDEVKQTFMELAGSMEMLEAPTLPTMSLSHLVGRGLRDSARNAGGPLGYLPRSIADALESQPGNTLNAETMDFMHGKLSLTDDGGTTDLYRWIRFGQGDRVARATVDAFLHGTPGQRLAIVKNGVYSTLLAMAKVKEPAEGQYADLGDYMSELGKFDVTSRVNEMFENHLQGQMIEGGDPGRIYRTDEFGNPVRGPKMPDGTEIPAAILSNQLGDVSLPNLVEARRFAQAIKATKVRRVLAAADDAMYKHFTQAIWKPLELTSLSYAEHIAGAEFVPNTLREGLVRSVGSRYTQVLARMGYEGTTDDPKGLAGYLWRMGGARLVNNSDDAEAVMKYYALSDGAHPTPGLMAGEVTTGETAPSLRAENGLKQTGAVPGYASDDWAHFENDSQRFAQLHRQSFAKAAKDRWSNIGANAYLRAAQRGDSAAEGTIEARDAVARALRREPPEILNQFGRNYGKRGASPEGWDNITDWADSIVSGMKGVIHGRPTDPEGKVAGPINMDLLHSLKNGHIPPLKDFEDLTAAERPLRVEGRIILGSPRNFMSKFANGWFAKVVNPIVDGVSRQPEFISEYVKQYKDLQAAVDKGTISDDERVVMSAYRSTTHGLKFVHNLTDRTQWTTTLRNWAPFYFAQEQAYRRMGRFLVEDPGGFRRYQMAIAAVANVANTYADGNGNQYITFPGSGYLGKLAAQAMGLHGLMVGNAPPAMFGGSLSSASIVFPMSNGVAPNVGPLGAIGAQTLITMFEHLGKDYSSFTPVSNVAVQVLNALDSNQGSYNEPILEQLIPNTTVLRGVQLYEAAKLNGGGGEEGFNSAVMQAYNMFDYMQAEATDKWVKDGAKGKPPEIIPTQQEALNNPRVMQAFVQKVKNYVITLYAMRAILGFASPISAEVEPNNFGFSQKLQDAINKEGSLAKGFTKFLAEYPAGAAYTVADSFVPDAQGQPTGISLPSSLGAQQWLSQHDAKWKTYGPAFLWLMPQQSDTKYSSTVYNEQVADGMRVRETPAEHLDQLYIAAGNAVYYKNLAIFENALAGAGKDSTAKNAEYNTWDRFVAQLGQQYPIWYDNFKSPDKYTNANQAITTLNTIFDKGDAPAGPQSAGVESLLKSFAIISTQYNQAGVGVSYSTQQYQQSQVSDEWTNYLETTATDYPALKPVIQTVFMHALKAP
jgi:hypothetical protein